MNQPRCCVTTKNDPDREVALRAEHYEQIRDLLDQGEKGWREFVSHWGDGKFFCRVEDIVEVFLCTPSYCENRDAFDKQLKLEGAE